LAIEHEYRVYFYQPIRGFGRWFRRRWNFNALSRGFETPEEALCKGIILYAVGLDARVVDHIKNKKKPLETVYFSQDYGIYSNGLTKNMLPLIHELNNCVKYMIETLGGKHGEEE